MIRQQAYQPPRVQVLLHQPLRQDRHAMPAHGKCLQHGGTVDHQRTGARAILMFATCRVGHAQLSQAAMPQLGQSF